MKQVYMRYMPSYALIKPWWLLIRNELHEPLSSYETTLVLLRVTTGNIYTGLLYIPRRMQTVHALSGFCFVLIPLSSANTKYFRTTSLAPGHSDNSPNPNQVSLKNKAQQNCWYVYGIYNISWCNISRTYKCDKVAYTLSVFDDNNTRAIW